MRAHNVQAQLHSAISRGEFLPGQKLNEVAMAARFDVSRNTLREAFAVLSTEGLVERIPNRGVFITEPSGRFARDLYRARAALEPGALRWGEYLDVASLRETVDQATAARDADQLDHVALANQKFHSLIVASMGSDALNAMMDQLLACMRLVFLSIHSTSPGFHASYVDDNRGIVELLEKDERTAAADTLYENLARTAQHVQDLLSD